MKNEYRKFRGAIVDKKISYQYSNGKICEHTTYIKSKTLKKESNGAKAVKLFEKTTRYEEVAFGTIEPVSRYKYITTMLLD